MLIDLVIIKTIDIAECKDLIANIVKARAVHKRKITLIINRLKELKTNDSLNQDIFNKQNAKITEILDLIKINDEEILKLFEQYNVETLDLDFFEKEFEGQINYHFNIDVDLSEFCDFKFKESNLDNSNVSNIEKLLDQVCNKNNSVQVRLPTLQCCTFSGTSKDTISFNIFFNQFMNIIGHKDEFSSATKLSYLVSYLSDYALKVVSHLSIINDNYIVALDLLKREFLNKNLVISEAYDFIIKNSVVNVYDEDFVKTKNYINDVRGLIFELRSHDLDFMQENSAGNSILSHILFNNLPLAFKRQMILVLNDNYPTLQLIFDNYHHVIETLLKTCKKPSLDKNYVKGDGKLVFKSNKVVNVNKQNTLQNFCTKDVAVANKSVSGNNFPKYCKLCQAKGHFMNNCSNFNTLELRIRRAKQLNLCNLCSAAGHSTENCFGNNNKLKYSCMHCKNKSHISAFCPVKFETTSNVVNNVCINFNSLTCNQMVLPTLTVELFCGTELKRVRALIDTASQRSYVSSNIVKHLVGNFNSLSEEKYNIQTFIGNNFKNFKQICLGLRVDKGNNFTLPFLVDENLKLEYNVNNMNAVIKNLKNQNVKLADSYFYSKNDYDKFDLEMLLGIDILQYFPSLVLSQCGGGSCFKINDKFIILGNINNFLSEKQIVYYRDNFKNVPSKQIKEYHEVGNYISETVVNNILNPVPTYFNPLSYILDESTVDHGLEYMFSLESLGIQPSVELNNFETEMVGEFERNIEFKNNKYFVKLPWLPQIKEVPCNYNIALKVSIRVKQNLINQNMLTEYNKVFENQIKEGVLEKITVNQCELDKYTFIPHRPVIKSDEQVTTKIRPVLNCSYTPNKETPSLNSAVFCGVNLFNSLLRLLMYFRTNKFVVLSDIKNAFLSIYLKEENDKNHFCLIWHENDNLVFYRYKTLTFGLSTSPFILHYVMKKHVSQYVKDKASDILSSNFFVDNLLYTSNSIPEIEDLYKKCYDRMKEGGFVLRSWNSNSSEFREVLKRENKFVEHNSNLEKVLGYKFDFVKDSLFLNVVNYNYSANTKRQILSETSKTFDPFGFCLPVIVRSKLLMREIWLSKCQWDDRVNDNLLNIWSKLCKDLSLLHTLEFKRSAVEENQTYSLVIFCDSSQAAYAFVAYAVCKDPNIKPQFLFAKTKVSPVKQNYSIPSLEFIAVILALKCLENILLGYKNILFDYILFAVDSQVVLQWLLKREPKTASKFVKNRISEFISLSEEIQNKFKIPFFFKYVKSEFNAADVLTRGVSFNTFENNLKLYLNGPEFLNYNVQSWPTYELLSLAPEVRSQITCVNVHVEDNNLEIIDASKFSSFNKLMKITYYVFKLFCNKSKQDPYVKAMNYWILKSQSKHFSEEIKFLSIKDKKEKVPILVSNLNLFLDERGMLRSRGRIAKCNVYDYNVHNPIVLLKNHHFTKLLVLDSHVKVSHMGLGTTLNYIRTKGFWIPQSRSLIKRVINDCIICKKINAVSFRYPKYANLSKNRMKFIRVFENTGIDFTGSVLVLNEKTGNLDKMYILIFTCLNIRAIHLELIPDMSVKHFLLAFQRFCNLYSIPNYLYSDNARTFVKGANILNELMSSNEFTDELIKNNVKHIKIPMYSAFLGSSWERLIRVVKCAMYKIIGKSKLTYFQLLTVLSSIKNSVNTRPLSYQSDQDDLRIITPNSFLKLNNNSSFMFRDEKDEWMEDNSSKLLDESLKHLESLNEEFKRIWYESYLLSLRELNRDLYQVEWKNRIKVDDVVLIKSPVKKRPYWMIGRVLELIIGHDNKVRVVKIKQSNGVIATHTINNLYPLELSVTNDTQNDVPSNELEPNQNVKEREQEGKPKRRAAVKFKEFLQSKKHLL